MTWSLMNRLIAGKVDELLDAKKDEYPPQVKRWFSREQAAEIIHAALWGHAVREGSDAGAYAAYNLFKALHLSFWTFDRDIGEACRKLAHEMTVAKASELDQSRAMREGHE